MIDFNQNITKELQASAERFFVGFGENTRSVEVKIYEKEHVLSIKIYNKKSFNAWLSIIEIKRFYDFCKNQHLVQFAYNDWYFSSISEYCNDFIKIIFHLKK